MTKQELEAKLDTLRKKWIGHVPKSSLDPNWWRFKADKCLAERIKTEIAMFDKPLEGKELCAAAEKIFNS